MYDIILVIGEQFFDHPMSGAGLLKRLLEKYGYSVGIVEQPQKSSDVTACGVPKLFFGVTSGAIDSMVCNYTPLKKKRSLDAYSDYEEKVKDRANIVYTNWIKEHYKDVPIVLGGTESTLRRFAHYDYWQNRVRKPLLFDAKADLLVYGNGEKQILEIASRLREGRDLHNIIGTCEIVSSLPEGVVELPSFTTIVENKDKFCDMHNMINNYEEIAQQVDNRFMLQHKSPHYTSEDLDEYYELPFTRKIPKTLAGFEFSVVTHRGCIGNCSFCALKLVQGEKIISRSEKSILREITELSSHPSFKGNIDDMGGPSTNMYGMDCDLREKCRNTCISCTRLNRSAQRATQLLRDSREIKGVKHTYVRSGVRFDLAPEEYVEELITGDHLFDYLRIAPEHTEKHVLELMNKNHGDLKAFISLFERVKKRTGSTKELAYYFMTAHPGSTLEDAKKLGEKLKQMKNTESVQVFIPTPMTTATCMYWSGKNPKNKEKIYVPYSYSEKKEQKRVCY